MSVLSAECMSMLTVALTPDRQLWNDLGCLSVDG